MYFDLNVPVPTPALARAGAPQPAKKDKGKGKAPPADAGASFSPAQLAALEARIDLLVHRAPCPSRCQHTRALTGHQWDTR
jgi:ribonuclease P/MRP protein subunit RPP1